MTDEKRAIIEKILSIEWEMFIAVNEGFERANCQEDRETFNAMRMAQYEAWPPAVSALYLDDLETARKRGCNLVEEKYIHMMKTTNFSQYNSLLSRITKPSDAANTLAKEISDILLEQTRILFEEYPYVSSRGRPLYAELDFGDTSVETYQLCELLTYSDKTLAALKEHIDALEKENKSLARMILENTVRYYGYDSLDAAEAVVKDRAEKSGIRVSFGCCAGKECEL